jgi:predicted acylesterase/phospholipase RssA
MGAYIAVAYACGFSHDRVLDLIAGEMATPRKWRLLPGGGLAHMAYMYRRGGWRKKARQYFGEPAFEDLALPTYTVAADLLSGKSVVRGQGDAVEALLESINFPGLAKPILREGMALVDGGVLNNLPSDVVRQRGADRVIAVDVNGKFQNTFGRSATAAAPRHPSAMETLLRVLEVRMRKLSRSRSHAPDLLIAPDVGGFGFTDYDRAHEAAARGQEAAEAMIPALQVMLAGRTA